MFYLAVPAAAGLAALGVLVLFRRGLRQRDPLPSGRRRLFWVAALVLLGLGIATAVGAAVSPVAGLDVGWGAIPVAALLVAVGLLAFVRPGQAGAVLASIGGASVLLMALLALLTFLFDRAAFDAGQIAPAVAAIGVFTIPAVVTGSLLLAAGTPSRPSPRR